MGFLHTNDTMVDNSMKQLSDVLNSKFTTYLQGNGTPVLVTYYNVDLNTTTTDLGSGSVDQLLGPQSPIRYNKILDFPVYGLKDLIPSVEELDGALLDMEMDTEVVILPNTIKPSFLDYFVYEFLDGRHVTFKVTNIEHSSIKSNNYYKLSLDLQDINNEYSYSLLEKQVIATYKTELDVIGTHERCIVEDTVYDTIESIRKMVDYTIQIYMDTFYEPKYNAIMFRDNTFEYPLFDPYLTKFVIDNNVLDSSKKYIVLVGYDMRHQVSVNYNKSIYKNLEIRDRVHLHRMARSPIPFRTVDTNPYVYYGEEMVYSMDLVRPSEYKDYGETDEVLLLLTPCKSEGNIYKYDYLDIELLHRMENAQPYPEDYRFLKNTSIQFGNILIDFLSKGNLHGLVTQDVLERMVHYEIKYCYDDFIYIPMLMYVMKEYMSYLRNNR